MQKLTALCVLLLGCTMADELSSSEQAVAGSDRLDAHEALYPGEWIASGNTWLTYQHDNNLVLYQNGHPIWATMAGLGAPPDRFVMQGDCNAVVYAATGYVWASWTHGLGGGCSAHVIEGDWFICNGSQRVWSARGGGDCGGGGGAPGPWTLGGGLEVMPRIGDDANYADWVTAYYVHALQNTEIWVAGVHRTFWDMIDHGKFKVGLGYNGDGLNSFRVFFHYTPEGHWMIAHAQHHGWVRFRNSDNGSYTHWFGFTQGGIFDPTANHPGFDHSYKSLFVESGKALCIQPQWNNWNTAGELDIDFHRQLEVFDHLRADNSDPLTTCSGGCKNNNAHFIAAWGSPAGMPHYIGPMTVSHSQRGPVYNFHEQRNMAGYPELADVLAGRGIGVVTGYAVPR
jgi:hypothetical protein